MRRVLDVSVAVATVIGLMVSPAMGSTSTAADDFSSGGYSGSTGNIPWEGPWIEVGESDGAGSGAIQVQSGSLCSGQCLTTSTELISLKDLGAYRAVSLDAAETASLQYRLRYEKPPLLVSSAPVRVQTSMNSGAWSTLATHAAGTNGTFTSDLPVGGVVRIRFFISDLAVGASWGVDDVSVEITVPTITTTTTTSTSTLATITVPTTVPTVPTITEPTITLPGVSTTTITVDDNATTATTATGSGPEPPSRTTTTTEGEEGRTGNLPTTTTTTTSGVGDDATGFGGLRPPSAGDPQSTAPELRVVRGIDPGLAPQSVSAPSRGVQTDLLTRFLISSEDIVFDLLANAALGIVLAWVSLRRFAPEDS